MVCSHQVLFKSSAAGINPVDVLTRQGMFLDNAVFPYILGWDAAGVVEAVGKSVKRFKVKFTPVCMCVCTLSLHSLQSHPLPLPFAVLFHERTKCWFVLHVILLPLMSPCPERWPGVLCWQCVRRVCGVRGVGGAADWTSRGQADLCSGRLRGGTLLYSLQCNSLQVSCEWTLDSCTSLVVVRLTAE